MSIDGDLQRLDELHKRISFLEALACSEGHQWMNTDPLLGGGTRQVCSHCGKIRNIRDGKEI